MTNSAALTKVKHDAASEQGPDGCRLTRASLPNVAVAATGAARAQRGGLDVSGVTLTEPMVQNYIAAQKGLAELYRELSRAGDKPDPRLQEKLDAVARKNGFARYAGIEKVASAIALVMAGLDPETGVYTDPAKALEKEIARLGADATLTKAERELMLKDTEAALRDIEAAPRPPGDNIEIVRKLRKDIAAATRPF